MISLYPSKISELPLEQYGIKSAISLLYWVENTKSALWHWLIPNDAQTGIALDFQPVSVTVNNRLVSLHEWSTTNIQPDDEVQFVFEAQGSVVGGIFNVIGSVVSKVFKLFIKMPSVSTSSSTRAQGDEIDKANIKANQPKLNDPIPELFGRNRRYPDYLVQTRQIYINNEQYTFMHLCVGVGYYLINALEIYIGNTALSSLGSDASFEIFSPGADHSANEATQNWYPSPEVGGTSSAEAGLDINPTYSVERYPTASSYSLGPVAGGDDDSATQGGYIAIPSGAGSFPNGWTSGMEVAVYAPQNVEFTNDNGNAFIGAFDNIDFAVNDTVVISGDITGTFRIISKETDSSGNTAYSLGDENGNAISWISAGTYSVYIISRGARFVISSTDAVGTWTDNDNDGVNDTDEDDDDTNDNEYTPAQQIIVEYVQADGNTYSDWAGFTARNSTVATVTLTDDGASGGWAGPFPVCPVNEVTNRFEWDIFFPNGLINYGQTSDKTYSVTFPYELQYRDMAEGGEWTTISRSITQKTADQYAVTDSLTLDTAARYEVRIRRSSAPAGDQYTQDTGQWYGLRSLLDRPSSYANITSIALKIRTGSRLAAQTENQVWCYATRMLAPFDDASGTLVATRDIAPAMMYILRSRGYSNDDVEMTELARLHAIWQERSDTFDMAYSDDTSVKDACNNILGAGRAELTVDRGIIVPVRDEARTTFDHMYSPQNMTGELKISLSPRYAGSSDDYDGLTVEYNNLLTGQKETVDCLVGDDAGSKMDTRTIYGVTDRTKVYQLGLYYRAVTKYCKRTYEWPTGFDALNSSYLNYCQVSGDYDQYSQSGQVLGFTTSSNQLHLQLDLDLDWDTESDYVITFRLKDGTAAGPYTVLGLDDNDMPYIEDPGIAINTDLQYDFTHYVYGKRSSAYWPVLIKSVSPSGSPLDEQEPQVTVQALNYDERVYQFDDAIPTD